NFTGGTNSSLGSTIWNDPDLLAVRIDHREVEPIKLLARGGFGEVWLGLYMNENVAIKRLLSDKKSTNDALQFATEIRLMARLDHPKIVRFIGVSWSNALTIQAITEFMDCGDLKSLLDSNRSSSLTWANLKCQIAIDVADALVYLHTLSPKMIHRDLKSRNVLIDAQTGAKLSDFGISRDRPVEETMTAGVGTARWIAPEVVLGGHYTESADIYSYGVVLSELDTCKAPFHDAQNTNGAKMQDVTILQLVSAGKLQPSFTDSCPPSILKLARSCLEFDPLRRPTAMQIMYELRNILKNELK
ncbi:Tkl protein kinase, partial [Globisporangium polare]